MRKIYTLCVAFLYAAATEAQTIFWLEEFTNGCTSLCTSYTGPNGAWTFTNAGPANACGGPTTPNLWYISCAENGNAAGACGTGCGNNATLHVGNDPNSPSAGFFCPTGDCGAAYDAGGSCDILGTPPSTITDIQAISPTIDCSGRTNITLTFNYIERGQGVNDNATVLYFDGSSWSVLADMPKTPNTCATGQGRWTAYTYVLPASADNNPNVAVAFHWVNDDDGTGNDPSFAVDSIQLSVPAGALPTAGFTESTTSGCDSLCVTFTDASSAATSIAWSFPGGTPSSSTQANPVVCYNTPGTFDVMQVVTNASGNDTLLKSALVTIIPTPVPDFSSTGQNLCVGDCIDYTDLSTGTVQIYSWILQGGNPTTSSDQNPANVCYNVAGLFNTTLTVTNNGCTNSNTHVGYVTVSQAIQPVISVSGDTLQSTSASTYQWYSVATGAIPSAIFQFYVASTGGDYYVCTTDAAGCPACSDTVHIKQVSVHEFDLHKTFKVHPNPVHDRITIGAAAAVEGCTMKILDKTGRMVMQQEVTFIANEATISIESLSGGSYFLQMMDAAGKIIFSTGILKN